MDKNLMAPIWRRYFLFFFFFLPLAGRRRRRNSGSKTATRRLPATKEMAVCRPALSPSAQRPNELLVIALCLFPPTRHSSSLYVALKQIKSKKKEKEKTQINNNRISQCCPFYSLWMLTSSAFDIIHRYYRRYKLAALVKFHPYKFCAHFHRSDDEGASEWCEKDTRGYRRRRYIPRSSTRQVFRRGGRCKSVSLSHWIHLAHNQFLYPPSSSWQLISLLAGKHPKPFWWIYADISSAAAVYIQYYVCANGRDDVGLGVA